MIDNWIGRRFPLLAFALNNLTRARARTGLAMAGIAIGVVAIAALGMGGAAFQQSQLDSASSVTQSVWVTPGEDAEFREFGPEHVDEVRQETNHPLYTIQQDQRLVAAKKAQMGATVYTLSDPGQFVNTTSGDVPSNWRSGVLVGQSVARNLDVQSGDAITVGGEQRRVVAILEENSRSAIVRTNDAVVLPSGETDRSTYDIILVQTNSPSEAFETSAAFNASLNPGRDQRYAVQDAEQSIEQFNQLTSTIQTFLLAIGGISLLVASVSIFNVMLMSAIERKEEIGVLRAVGYHRVDVLRLMLNEAILLGVVGALIGVGLSIVLGMVINAQFLSGPLAFSIEALQWAVLGFIFGTVASFLSGLYPAWKAANARPVEALRD